MNKETIKAGQITIDFLVEAADTKGSVSMFEFTVPAGAKVPIPHYHENFDETIYGISGTLTFSVDGETTNIAPGGSGVSRGGAVHGFDNLKPVDAKGLAVITPALLGPIFFREVAEIVNTGLPPDLQKLAWVMSKHGLIPVVPKKETI